MSNTAPVSAPTAPNPGTGPAPADDPPVGSMDGRSYTNETDAPHTPTEQEEAMNEAKGILFTQLALAAATALLILGGIGLAIGLGATSGFVIPAIIFSGIVLGGIGIWGVIPFFEDKIFGD